MIGREVTAQSLGALLPNPGSLFCEAAASIAPTQQGQRAIAADPTTQPVYVLTYASLPPIQWVTTSVFWPITMGSLILPILAETLMRFRVIAALAPHQPAHTGRMALADGITLAWQRFGTVAVHIWLLRAATACAQVLFLAAPLTLAQHIFIPRLAHALDAPWMNTACVLLAITGSALVNGALVAFSTFYDARLFMALTNHNECIV